MAVKIYDVAKAAGVTSSTVSRVFNGYPDISEHTRKKVYEVAAKLGYTPNIAARTLSSKSLKTVALILNDLVASRFDGVSMQTILGVYNYCETHAMQFVLYPTTTKLQHEKTFDQFCMERNVAGAVVQGLHIDDPYIQQISESQTPVVMIDLEIPGANTVSISVDNVAAEKEATQAILRHGKSHPVMMNGIPSAQVSNLREKGFREAIHDAGLSLSDDAIMYADFDIDKAEAAMRNALASGREIDAVICASDAMAMGVMTALKAAHRRVPEDCEVVGFDNIAITEYSQPTISTIDQHMEKIGGMAAQLVDKLLNGKVAPNMRHIFSPHKFIQRESTGVYPDK
ncbi:LacI family DNA-binding transcriptional regulator [Lacticaseibacillus mingshuiensis]|uniref:LacI family DNA-binding transcriptional regulator n=1 Tax=Lacticaseibacillus mingshuiensis TaxID=2799574 RepID=A0ABW4CGZ3_9LACO|nr:LacI family DNA-binding transcriptional regulator [Lacticaseibacillus mingshuiensis]